SLPLIDPRCIDNGNGLLTVISNWNVMCLLRFILRFDLLTIEVIHYGFTKRTLARKSYKVKQERHAFICALGSNRNRMCHHWWGCNRINFDSPRFKVLVQPLNFNE